MKTNLLIILFFSLFFLQNETYAKKNKILFKVNDKIITSLDVLEEAKYLVALNSELENAEKNRIYEIAKKSLIRHKIKEIELDAKLNNFNIDNATLNDLVFNQFKKIGIKSNSELKQYFIKSRLDTEHIYNRTKIQILWNEYIYAKFFKQVKINEKKIKEELENKKKQNEYLLSEILFNLVENENLNKKMSIIEETIVSKGFSEAALTFSISATSDNGGNLGWIKETSLNKNIRNKINKLNLGKHTKPITVPGGFLILKINNKRTSEINIDLKKEIMEITKKQTNEQLSQFSIMYFNKINKDIEINEY